MFQFSLKRLLVCLLLVAAACCMFLIGIQTKLPRPNEDMTPYLRVGLLVYGAFPVAGIGVGYLFKQPWVGALGGVVVMFLGGIIANLIARL